MPPPPFRSDEPEHSGEWFSEHAPWHDLDSWIRSLGYSTIAGVDEVGRGPLAGPVVAAAVVLPDPHGIEGLRDSKQLSASRRETLDGQIRACALAIGLGVVGPERIDSINILQASLEAMSEALRQVLELGQVPSMILVDGNHNFALPAGSPPLRQQPLVKADQRSETVAAASIVAKVFRDRLMSEYHQRWPQYGFDQHKGYPTAAHKQAVLQHGPCAIHRRTFAGVREVCA